MLGEWGCQLLLDDGSMAEGAPETCAAAWPGVFAAATAAATQVHGGASLR